MAIDEYHKNLIMDYGISASKIFREYTKTNRIITRTKNTRNFLLKCRNNRIIPKFITHKTTLLIAKNNRQGKTKWINNFIARTNKGILNYEIRQTIKKLNKLEQHSKKLQWKMLQSTTKPIAKDYIHNTKRLNRVNLIKISERTESKYNKLEEQQTPKISFNPEWLKNMSNTELPNEVQAMLALGPKFAVCPEKNEIPIEYLIADVEDIIESNEDKTTHNSMRSKATTIISNHLKKHSQKNSKQIILQKTYKSTKKFLKDHPELVVTSADKGNITIVMEKEEYNKKLLDSFNNHDKYRELAHDPTLKLEEENNKLVKQLYKDKLIDKKVKKRLLNFTSQAPAPKCAPKVHKEGVRIIVNNKNGPGYNMSKYINEILKSIITENDYNIKNSYELKTIIDNTTIDNDDRIISYDIVEMYEKIPIQEVIKSLEKRKNQIQNITKIPWRNFMIMIDFCINKANYFCYNKKTYKQRNGLIIGGPISSILADFVTTDILNQTIYELGYTPTIIKKYVDDILIIINKEEIEELSNILNKFHKSIKFTLEVENDKQLPYLDMCLHRRPKKIDISLYQKPTSKNRLMNYSSAHTTKQKEGMVYGYVSRILNITSECFKDHSIRTIHHVLDMNGYPRNLINKMIHKFQINQQNTNTQSIEKTTFKSLLYIPSLSESLKNVLQNNNPKLQIGLKPIKTIENICNQNKQKTETMQKHGVIYQFGCNDCEKVYIGQTGQRLKNRLRQHRNDAKDKRQRQRQRQTNKTNNTEKINNNTKNQTAALSHIKDFGHSFDYGGTKIISQHKNWKKRLILEAIHININNSKVVNLRSDMDNLHPTYCTLLNNIKKTT